MNIISFQNIFKSYGTNPVIHDLSFDAETSKIFGLLGPNGAGKTTLMRLMTNITVANSGTVLYNGAPITKNDVRKIGYMPEERGLYSNMKVFEHLFYIAKLYNLNIKEARKSIDHWLTKLEMLQYSNKLIGALSKGMSQKIQFIATVLHNPDLLVLDEPFSGLDPISSQALEKEFIELKKNGVSIILSTHRMDQIELLCDNVLLINKGRKLIQSNVQDLKNSYKENIVEIKTASTLTKDIIVEFDLEDKQNNCYSFVYKDSFDRQNLFKSIIRTNIDIISYNEMIPKINDIFIKLILKGNLEKPNLPPDETNLLHNTERNSY